MTIKKKVGQEEVQLAIKKFLNHGGIIHKLPDQDAKNRKVIGEERYDIYESLSNLPTLG